MSSMRAMSGAAAACPPSPSRREPLPGLQPASVHERIAGALDELRKSMPAGTLLETGGTVEKSAQSNAALLAQFPLMITLMLTVLMVQLGSFRQLAMVISVAPLGLIGVAAALLTTQHADGLHRDARDHCAGRHDHPQLGDPGRPDRA